jgi:hypothetical protein
MSPTGVWTRPTRIGRSPAIKPEASNTGASMAYEYRVIEAEDGTFPVELWSSQGGRGWIQATRDANPIAALKIPRSNQPLLREIQRSAAKREPRRNGA